MKACWVISSIILAAVPANAQSTGPIARADVQAAVGWQNLRAGPTLYSGHWTNGIALVDAAAGFYWTDHLRTQVDAGVGTEGRQYAVVGVARPARTAFETIEARVQPVTFAITQQYQFFENAYFHPHVGVGVLLRHEHVAERHDVYEPEQTGGIRSDTTRFGRTRAAAVVDGGFKAYLSPRAFVVTDARFTIRQQLDGVLLRFGFGVDF